MQNWVKDLSAYVKSIDPAHLVMVSSWGYFGASTPELQPENPFDLTWRGIGNNAGVCCFAPSPLPVQDLMGGVLHVQCTLSAVQESSCSLEASHQHVRGSLTA